MLRFVISYKVSPRRRASPVRDFVGDIRHAKMHHNITQTHTHTHTPSNTARTSVLFNVWRRRAPQNGSWTMCNGRTAKPSVTHCCLRAADLTSIYGRFFEFVIVGEAYTSPSSQVQEHKGDRVARQLINNTLHYKRALNRWDIQNAIPERFNFGQRMRWYDNNKIKIRRDDARLRRVARSLPTGLQRKGRELYVCVSAKVVPAAFFADRWGSSTLMHRNAGRTGNKITIAAKNNENENHNVHERTQGPIVFASTSNERRVIRNQLSKIDFDQSEDKRKSLYRLLFNLVALKWWTELVH